MDVKNSPAGHVTEKYAIRQMSFTTDDSNDYDELVHLFASQNKQNPPATSGDETKLKKPQPQPGVEDLMDRRGIRSSLLS